MQVGDMPFGTYEFEDTDVALRNAYRFVKEGGCDAVKLEVRVDSKHKLSNCAFLKYFNETLGWKHGACKNCSKNRRWRR